MKEKETVSVHEDGTPSTSHEPTPTVGTCSAAVPEPVQTNSATTATAVAGDSDQESASLKQDPVSTATVVESDESCGVVPREGESESHLSHYNISAHNTTWQKYAMENLNICDVDKFDFIVTEPPTAPSRSFIRRSSPSKSRFTDEIGEEEVKQFPNCAKRILKVGGYCLLLLPYDMFPEWYGAFTRTGFEVMSQPYTIQYDENTYPRRGAGNKIFPQTMTGFAVIAKAPGDHPGGFMPDFDASYSFIQSCASRRQSAIDSVPFVKHKLTRLKSRSPYRTSEKPHSLLSELIDLFTPPQGSVLDPFAGTLSTAIASMRVGRACTVVERDSDCYNAAFHRLQLVATALFQKSLHRADESVDDDVIFVCMSKVHHADDTHENADRNDVEDTGGKEDGAHQTPDYDCGQNYPDRSDRDIAECSTPQAQGCRREEDDETVVKLCAAADLDNDNPLLGSQQAADNSEVTPLLEAQAETPHLGIKTR